MRHAGYKEFTYPKSLLRHSTFFADNKITLLRNPTRMEILPMSRPITFFLQFFNFLVRSYLPKHLLLRRRDSRMQECASAGFRRTRNNGYEGGVEELLGGAFSVLT